MLAKKASYADGKAVNGWNSRPTSPRASESVEARLLNEEDRKWIGNDAKKLGTKLVGEIADVPMPE